MSVGRAYRVDPNAPIEARLALVEQVERPVPAGHVRVAVETVALNNRDIKLLEGVLATRKATHPYTPCSDAAGRIVECGAGVSQKRLGEHVCTTLMPLWNDGPPSQETLVPLAALAGGVLAETIIMPAEAMLSIPTALDMQTAAASACAGATAWAALHTKAVQPGMRILVTGTGGVSLYVLQLALAQGASVFVTTSSIEKGERARNLGAVASFDYRSNAWPEDLFAATNGAGVDLVIDSAGGETLAPLVSVCAVGGAIALVGFIAGSEPRLPLALAIPRGVTLHAISAASRNAHEALLTFLAVEKLPPILDSVFSFEDAPAAFDRLASGQHFGKIIIDVTSHKRVYA